MRFLYSLAFAFLVSAGILFITQNMHILGFITIGIGSICLLANAFSRKGGLFIFLLSCITIVIVCAFTGIQPLASAKDDIANSISKVKLTSSNTSTSQQPNDSVVMNGKALKVIQSWTGNEAKTVNFKTDKSPVIVVYGGTKTSQFGSTLYVYVQGGSSGYYPDIGTTGWIDVNKLGMGDTGFVGSTQSGVLQGSGKFRLWINSTGCNWWVKVAIEQ
jgi:hypothetical protein